MIIMMKGGHGLTNQLHDIKMGCTQPCIQSTPINSYYVCARVWEREWECACACECVCVCVMANYFPHPFLRIYHQNTYTCTCIPYRVHNSIFVQYNSHIILYPQCIHSPSTVHVCTHSSTQFRTPLTQTQPQPHLVPEIEYQPKCLV